MKKRLFLILLALFVLMALPAECYASGAAKYDLPDLGLSMALPDYYYVLSRDISTSDPVLTLFGMSREECISSLESSNVYLDAFDQDLSTEIVISMTENLISDLNLLPDSTIDLMISTLSETYSGYGATVTETEYYQHKQAKFLVLSVTQDSESGTVYGIQYYTIYDCKAINVVLHSFDGPVTALEKKLIKTIVDSIEFESAPITPEPAPNTEAFVYTDPETETTFTVPENWETSELSKPRETIDVKFVSTDKEAVVMYGSIDAWSQFTAAERAGTKRADCDMTALSDDDLKEFASLVGAADGAYMRKTISGTDYCLIQTKNSQGSLSVPITAYFTVNNGYIYFFQYNGGNSNAHYDDFMSILKSVEYKSVSAEPDGSNGYSMIVVLAVAGLAVGAVLLLMIRSGKKKEAAEPDAVHPMNAVRLSDTETTEPEIENNPAADVLSRCPSCGREIPFSSKFCQFCGSRLDL